MTSLFLYNTLTRKKENFIPIYPGRAGIYTCGPTVYNYAHIGNLRTYIFEDILKRVLTANEYAVTHVMNITDVGHLTGDGDLGEDKLEKGAAREGKTAWEVAAYYTEAFQKDMARLNLLPPDIWCRATDTIPEQIALIRTLEKKEFTYQTSDGIYFDTARFPDYTKLSHQNLDALQEGARVEKHPEKRNPSDFALWKFSPEGAKRQMEWPSPWGVGFPGWHIECSAMSMKYLGDMLDIHCGGTDHIHVHHTNEIAQSEAATGKPFFRFWMHGEFLNIAGGKKMAKSGENFLTVENALVRRGIDPLAYRYAAFQTHYRHPMEYSGESIRAAENGYRNMKNAVREIVLAADAAENRAGGSPVPSPELMARFMAAVNDDLNMPRAMAVLQECLKANLPPAEKKATLLAMDRITGFGLDKVETKAALPPEIETLVADRKAARKEKNWAESDRLREELVSKGYTVRDHKDGMDVFAA
ncbi:MAG: cysteine--tRNA ligase [Desulfococcus sp.]|nr:MAG: cysteine--tRNA ligase [Desulfococcus sp.]